MGERWSDDGVESYVTRVGPGCLVARKIKKEYVISDYLMQEMVKWIRGCEEIDEKLDLVSCYRVAKPISVFGCGTARTGTSHDVLSCPSSFEGQLRKTLG
jgi:hypothetical protein